MNQIQTLDHHGRRRRTERSGTTAAEVKPTQTQKIPNGAIAPSSKNDFLETPSERIEERLDNYENRIVEKAKNKDEVESISNPSQADDFSFTLPKPQNITGQKVYTCFS